MNFTLAVHLPRKLQARAGEGRPFPREFFFERAWAELAVHGLVGVHEGTVLSEDAARLGLETESWTVDSAEAPRERDWVGHAPEGAAELYFASRAGAELGRDWVAREWPGVVTGEVREVVNTDWDAEWKKSFTGVEVPPFWSIVPPWLAEADVPGATPSWPRKRRLVLNPGAGFGTGTHETTQLCLKLLAESPVQGARVLDFGSGSGILAVAAAILDAKSPVDAVEIDELAIENARENARLNGVEDRIRFGRELLPHLERNPDSGRVPGHVGKQDNTSAGYDIVLANILRPVLIQFASELVSRLQDDGGLMILSGLIERDVDEVVSAYQNLGLKCVRRESLNEWRALALVRQT